MRRSTALMRSCSDSTVSSGSTITMPSSPATKKWFVKKPKSKMLVVTDYNQTDRAVALNTYRIAIDSAMPGKDYSKFDILDVGYGLSSIDKQNQLVNQKYGSMVPINMNPALIHTLKLFDVVLWISDLYPSYLPAQIGLFNYTQTGGKVIFTTTFAANVVFAEIRALNDFAPIDSVSTDVNSTTVIHTNADGRMPIRTKVLSLSTNFPEMEFDTITSGSFHTFNWRRIYKRTDAQYLYRLDSSKFYTSPFRYASRPEIGVINNDKNFVLIALPLHKLNGGNKNLPVFFKRVLMNEFGLN
jgi:hypothetical protein